MKVILHGATHSSNFGDFLFAKIFYEELKKAKYEVVFYDVPKIGMSTFFKKFLHYNHKMKLKDLKDANMLVYMSGGYFGERIGNAKENIIRFIRYLPVGLAFIKMKKKICIVGVGGAPISNKWLRKKIVKIINYASLVIFRDTKTTEYFKENGVNNNIITTIDTAMMLSKTLKPDKNNTGVALDNKTKYIFLHLSGDASTDGRIEKIVLPAVNRFLKDNKGWGLIVGQDNIYKNDRTNAILSMVNSEKKIKYSYSNPIQLYNLLGSVDMILTPKLHVGIIGSSLGSSVISFPYHAAKTKRFYEQIEYPERCVPINNLKTEELIGKMNQFKNVPIVIPNELVELSMSNIDILLKIIAEYDEK